MFALLYAIGFGIALGLSVAAPPGPMNAIVARESQRSNWHGSSVGFGAMTADAILLVITFYFSKLIPSYIINFFYIAGTFILLYMAYGTLRAKAKETSIHANYFLGIGMGLTNPFQIAWWFTAGLFFITKISLIAIVGFFIGIVIWVFSFPYAIHKTKKYYEPKWINYISTAVLVAFAAFMFYLGLKGLGLF